MNRSETARLLAYAAAFDRRTVGHSDVLAWSELLQSVDYADGMRAVRRHYADQTTWIMPAHILRIVRRELLPPGHEFGQ